MYLAFNRGMGFFDVGKSDEEGLIVSLISFEVFRITVGGRCRTTDWLVLLRISISGYCCPHTTTISHHSVISMPKISFGSASIVKPFL